MELRRQTWIAAVKLAVVISGLAAIIVGVVSSIGHVSDVAMIAAVAAVAFAASWFQTGRVRNAPRPSRITIRVH